MNAAEFFEQFEAGLRSRQLPAEFRKLAGKQSKWKVPIADGVLHFKFATNPKVAGLLDNLLWPGEFRLTLEWQRGQGKGRKTDFVSLFQYTSDEEVGRYCELQRRALSKYLAAGGADPRDSLRERLADGTLAPKANIEQWCYYFDLTDAAAWGVWYGSVLATWVARFLERPESTQDWCWRVLWPHLRRNADRDLEQARIDFAEQVRHAAGLRSAALVRAFRTVPRERFMGPGPWKILAPPDYVTYHDTPDGDPRHLYANVLVALDASRRLNNGEPAVLAGWLDALDLAPGNRVLHIGCGVGYYTAIVAEAVSPGGNVHGIEIDPTLAERARRNLGSYANVTVASGDESSMAVGSFDAVIVNAGATQVQPNWIERLRPAGRLLVPLTVGVDGFDAGVGQMLLVSREEAGYRARFLSVVGIFHCAGARTEQGEKLLGEAFERGGAEAVRSLRPDNHRQDGNCWLHASPWCLSRLAVAERSPSSEQSRPA